MPGHDTAPPVDATGTRRRLQALGFMGHTQRSLAAQLGLSRDQLQRRASAGHVTGDFADTVGRLYDQLWNVTPTGPAADKARAAARLNGWVSPLAWDDDEIDDPAAVPDLGAPPAARPVVVAENLTWLMSCGYTLRQATARLGVTRGYVLKLEARFPGLTSQRGQVAA